MKLRVAELRRDAGDVLAIRLEHPRRPQLPAWTAGAHVDVHVPGLGVRHYSLWGDPDDRSHYLIAVRREEAGRGGSAWLHAALAPDALLTVAAPRNHFELPEVPRRTLLVAGGIGVTPLLAMARRLAHQTAQQNADFAFHYCARSRAAAPLLDEVAAICGDRLVTWFPEEGRRFDASAVLAAEPSEADILVCGPQRLAEAIEAAVAARGWPAECFHTERFAALDPGDFVPEPFEAVIASTGAVLSVPAERSLVAVLAEGGIELPTSCESGVCGSCECGYLQGEVVHRDVVLDARRRKTRLMPCVSRGRGRIVLDL